MGPTRLIQRGILIENRIALTAYNQDFAHTDFKRLGKKQVEERFEILLRNRGEESVEIVVLEHVWADWELANKTHPYEKTDACTVEFPVQVAAGAEVKVAYTVRTRWL